MLRSLPHGCPVRVELAKLCQKFGGRLIRLSKQSFEELDFATKGGLTFLGGSWDHAPFSSDNLALDWHHKMIAYSGDVSWVGIVHEMGHVFACTVPPKNHPAEYDFLGWEVVMAKRFDLEKWIEGNRDYVVEGDNDMSMLSRPALDEILAGRVRFAQALGLLTKLGNPRSVR